jgi:predicted small secreted protein
MKFAVVVLIALSLSGCGFTAQGDFARDVVRDKGAQAYDEGLMNSIWFICNAASVGSVRRIFGKSMTAYNDICMEPALRLEAAS